MKSILHLLLTITLVGFHLIGFSQTDGFKSESFIYTNSVDSTASPKDSVVKKVKSKTEEASTAKETTAKKVDTVKKVALVNVTELLSDTTNAIEDGDPEKNTPISKINEIISFGKIFWSIIIILIGYFTINLLIKIADSLAERNSKYRFTLKGLIPVIKIVGWALVSTVIIAGVFQPPFETVIAVTASVGIAVGFAAQDILKNIFGGIMIVFDRPFQVGDKIEIGAYYGEVVEIGLRSTRIVTKDDSLVSVPNSEAVNNAVSNSNSGESNCQVVAEIWLPIDLDTSKARAIALESAQVSPYVYLNKPIVVLFVNEIKERRSYLKMRVKAYVSDTRNEFVFMSDVTERVVKELLRQDVIKKEELF
tara:strand:+ start:3800 stop:4891 length:1092 start_codon:yes stop_codon:yes gene_type:complete